VDTFTDVGVDRYVTLVEGTGLKYGTVGPRTREGVETILAAYPHPEMGYRSCLGIIRLGERYPAARV